MQKVILTKKISNDTTRKLQFAGSTKENCLWNYCTSHITRQCQHQHQCKMYDFKREQNKRSKIEQKYKTFN